LLKKETRFRRTHRLARLACLLLPGIVGLAWSQSEDVVHVDIAAGPMDVSLLAFGQQTDVSIVFGREAIARFAAPAVTGSFTRRDALNALLKGACLSAEWIRPRLVAVKPECSGREEPPAAPELLLPTEVVSEIPEDPLQEEVLVLDRRLTGTRLASAGVQLPANIHTISRPEIEQSGHQTLSHLLRYVPAVSGNSTSTLVTNGGDGSATVTLRGLPARNTLVLLNGRRVNPDAFFGEAVDLNSLPLALIDQIEILKDGASAVYGSDAVAGVVNIHTRRNLSGLQGDVYIGRADAGGLETGQASVLFGREFRTFELLGGAAWYEQAALYSRERPLSASSDERTRGSIDRRSSAISPAWLTLPGGPVTLADGANGTSPGHYRPVSDEDRFEYRDFTSLIVPSRRASVFLDGRWHLGNGTALFLEAQGTRHESVNQLAPAPLFTAFERIPLPVEADQAWNPFTEDLFDVRRRLLELGVRKQHNRSTSRRIVAGASGSSAGVWWDVALVDAQSRARERFTGAANTARIAAALSSSCSLPCVPLNVFGPTGSIDASMLDWIAAEAISRGRSELRSAVLNIGAELGTLPAGPIDVALGFEYRRERLRSVPDPLLAGGLLLGSGSFAATSGRRSIWEAWVETRLPLLRDRNLISKLDLYLAGRHSVYNDFGKETNPRMVLHWVPVEGLGVRGSYSEAFRAPTLQQLFGGVSSNFEQFNDPCTLASNVGVLPGCTVMSDPALNQFVTIRSGNLELHPERSRTYSVAIEFARHWEQIDFSAAIDWFRIKQRDVVDNQAQFIINQNAAGRGFANRIVRDKSGNIARILSAPINIGFRDVRGLDVGGSVKWSLETKGQVEVAVQATRIGRFSDRLTPDSLAEDKAGTFTDSAAGGLGALPRWKSSVALRWQKKFWQAQFDTFLVSSIRETMPITSRQRTLEPWIIHNAQLSFQGPVTQWFRVTVGVNNLLDEPPPWSSAAFNDSYDSRTYDITGRYLYLRLDRSN
jgi:iron complex outermembrane receptor protein